MATRRPAETQLTPEALLALGAPSTVYVKEIDSREVQHLIKGLKPGIKLFSVHSADGTQMAVLDDRAAAFAAARQYALEPVSVH